MQRTRTERCCAWSPTKFCSRSGETRRAEDRLEPWRAPLVGARPGRRYEAPYLKPLRKPRARVETKSLQVRLTAQEIADMEPEGFGEVWKAHQSLSPAERGAGSVARAGTLSVG